MARHTLVRAREVNRRIERLGGVMIRQVGSHRRYAVTYKGGPGGAELTITTIVAQHAGDIPTGTLHKIERDLEAALGKGWLTK